MIPEEPKPPKPAPEPEPPKPKTPVKAPEDFTIHIEGDDREPTLGVDPGLGATGLDRYEKALLVENYATFADAHVALQNLMAVMTGALWMMEPEQRDEFQRYIDSVKRSRLQICYRDALHEDHPNRGETTDGKLYATEALAMAAVTKDFSEAQHRYLKKALKSGTISKDELVSEAYLIIGDDGSKMEISEEEYESIIDSLTDDTDEIQGAPPLLEPDEVYRFVQSVEDVDQDRGVDELVVRVMQQLVYYDTEARQLAEDTLIEVDELAEPIKRIVYQVDGKEFDSYSDALAVVRASGDPAFAAMMSEAALASLITRVEFTYSLLDDERTIISSAPVKVSSI